MTPFDTQHLHALAESALLKQNGINLSPEEITRRFAGYADQEFYLTVFREAGKTTCINTIIKKKWISFLTQARGNIQAISGAVDLVHRMKSADFKLDVTPASIPKFISIVVEALGIRDEMIMLTSSDEVPHGKPAPDVFLLPTQRLNSKPEECLVIEDGVNGMLFAKRAGMACIGYVQAYLAALHPEYPGSMVVDQHEKNQVGTSAIIASGFGER